MTLATGETNGKNPQLRYQFRKLYEIAKDREATTKATYSMGRYWPITANTIKHDRV